MTGERVRGPELGLVDADIRFPFQSEGFVCPLSAYPLCFFVVCFCALYLELMAHTFHIHSAPSGVTVPFCVSFKHVTA